MKIQSRALTGSPLTFQINGLICEQEKNSEIALKKAYIKGGTLMKDQTENLRKKINIKLKTTISMLLAAVLSFSCIMTVNAAAIKDDGKYTLILQPGRNGMDGKIDGDYSKMIRFDVADGDTTVSLSELTAGVLPFNGRTQFVYWATDWTGATKVAEDLPLSDFTSEGSFWGNDGEVKYSNALSIYATFSDEPLKGTGTYYLTLDGFGGKINGKYEITITSSSSEYQTVDLTEYTPVKEGYTFVGWDLNGEYVTSVPAECFKEMDAVTVLATYTKNTFDNNGIVLTLNANGGTLNGKESDKYDYPKGRDSGAMMSLLPYVPVRNGYTFNGWNTKSDGSGKNYKYMYWRSWDINEETDKEFDKDTVITEDNGYQRYKNITLYATWTENPYMAGDANGDNVISVSDARSALRIAVALDTPTAAQLLACDTDGDGAVTVADARNILRAAVGLDEPSSWKNYNG